MDSVKTDVKNQIILNYLFDSFDEASDVNNRENLEFLKEGIKNRV